MTLQTLVTLIADGTIVPIVLIAGVALLLYVPRGQKYEAYSRILMAGITSYLLAKLIGSIYQPSMERPFEILGLEAGASYLNNPGFPSDHILFAAFLTFAVWFETRRKDVTLVLALLVVIMGAGRVLALVHTPLDVVGGIAIAALGTLWYFQRLVAMPAVGNRTDSKKT